MDVPYYVPNVRENAEPLWVGRGFLGGTAHAEPLMMYSFGEFSDELTAIGISNRYICDRCVPFLDLNRQVREQVLNIPGIEVAYFDRDGNLWFNNPNLR